jgi:hypothetical protein
LQIDRSATNPGVLIFSIIPMGYRFVKSVECKNIYGARH